MGGCATKLKGVKADAGDLPAPEPAPPAKEEAGVVSETKKEVVEVVEEEKKVVVQEGEVKEREGDKDREIHDDDKVDDQGSKRRSLSLLFKEVKKFLSFPPFFLFSVCWLNSDSLSFRLVTEKVKEKGKEVKSFELCVASCFGYKN